MVIMPKKQDAFWLNWCGLSSITMPCINMPVWYSHIQCPNGHYDKTRLKREGRKTHWRCNVCGRMFWTDEYKPPTSVPR